MCWATAVKTSASSLPQNYTGMCHSDAPVVPMDKKPNQHETNQIKQLLICAVSQEEQAYLLNSYGKAVGQMVEVAQKHVIPKVILHWTEPPRILVFWLQPSFWNTAVVFGLPNLGLSPLFVPLARPQCLNCGNRKWPFTAQLLTLPFIRLGVFRHLNVFVLWANNKCLPC